jgi:hypothetical protein
VATLADQLGPGSTRQLWLRLDSLAMIDNQAIAGQQDEGVVNPVAIQPV